MERIRILDTHTGGEPTRIVLDGFPDLGNGSLSERRALVRDRFDKYRSALVNEPRGSDVLVAAILTPPTDPRCVAGVIFVNNVGVLNMCGHGTIGVGVALGSLGRISAGRHCLETPVGIVPFDYDGRHEVRFDNVPSYRLRAGVAVTVEGWGEFIGDVAWGGNWFFLVSQHAEDLAVGNVERLTEVAWRIRQALAQAGITGSDGAEIDHVELFGPARSPQNHSRNFVLCPGKAYDRSPCGTGTSAKLACLFADGKLRPGEAWRQESILGSVFVGSVRQNDHGELIPSITGTAYVTGEATLLLDPLDPFRFGIR